MPAPTRTIGQDERLAELERLFMTLLANFEALRAEVRDIRRRDCDANAPPRDR